MSATGAVQRCDLPLGYFVMHGGALGTNMSLVGIDVGTDSVRLCHLGRRTVERALQRYKRGDDRHTMSGESLWRAVVEMLDECGLASPSPDSVAAEPYTVCVAATCSMVVMKRELRRDGEWFVPVERGHEVMVWMDTRAKPEAAWVLARLPPKALAQIGGSVTPEMGLAKLKWLSDNSADDVYVFELYDWVSYLFLAGGYGRDGEVAYMAPVETSFAAGLCAMDGSVKGWAEETLLALGISVKVGAPMGATKKFGQPLATSRHITVAHGCIDCYAGWASVSFIVSAALEAAPNSAPSSRGLAVGPGSGPPGNTLPAQPGKVLMVAGTSTCFIASVADADRAYPGLWGPFDQLCAEPVYSFGQPATGQLLAELFAEFHDVVSGKDPFEFVEIAAKDLEKKHGASLLVLARHHLYYGDKHGNRGPYGDFRMGEVLVDGKNAAPEHIQVIDQHTSAALVFRYYLVLEFLALQTRHLCERLALGEVYITGLQAANDRFVQMLAFFSFRDCQVFVRHESHKYFGCMGAAYAVSAHQPENAWVRVHPVAEPLALQVLEAKYKAYKGLAEWQRQFRDSMKDIDHTVQAPTNSTQN